MSSCLSSMSRKQAYSEASFVKNQKIPPPLKRHAASESRVLPSRCRLCPCVLCGAIELRRSAIVSFLVRLRRQRRLRRTGRRASTAARARWRRSWRLAGMRPHCRTPVSAATPTTCPYVPIRRGRTSVRHPSSCELLRYNITLDSPKRSFLPVLLIVSQSFTHGLRTARLSRENLLHLFSSFSTYFCLTSNYWPVRQKREDFK